MEVRIYNGNEGSWWVVDINDPCRYLDPNGDWKNWRDEYTSYVTLRKNTSEWKKKFINSRRLAIAVAKRYIPDVKIECTQS